MQIFIFPNSNVSNVVFLTHALLLINLSFKSFDIQVQIVSLFTIVWKTGYL